MKLVVDANVLLSALIADSTTRELVVTLEPTLLAPAIVHDEVERHEDLVVERSGMQQARVRQFVELLFENLETVPVMEFSEHVERADAALGETDPDDVLYLACALGRDAAIWSDDADFDDQNLVPVFTTEVVVKSFDTV